MAIGASPSNYWIYVPQAYDATHATPITLFVWLHGCSGYSESDIYTVSGVAAQSYIAVTPGGREGGCWDVNADPARVLATIADVKTHFNINPRRVVLGGFSSGGDLAYRTAFYNARLFAGVLATNTAPFKDTNSSAAASIAAASWKFHIVHVAHVNDSVYPIDTVRAETNELLNAGFPIQRIERAGIHYEPDTATTGTDHDTRTLLLPHLNDDWLAPAS
jgi:phospholipase/carboxylesterase